MKPDRHIAIVIAAILLLIRGNSLSVIRIPVLGKVAE
jgi:hypothetical protein